MSPGNLLKHSGEIPGLKGCLLKRRHVRFVHLELHRHLAQSAVNGNRCAELRVEIILEQRRARLREKKIRMFPDLFRSYDAKFLAR